MDCRFCGGGVANSYGHTTATSRVGMAWWSCSYGRKHVRIVSDRKPISGRHVPSIFGPYSQDLPDFWCVYPKVGELVKEGRKTKLIITCKCGIKGEVKDIGWNGNYCQICQEEQQYLNDTGFLPGNRKRSITCL